MPGIPDTNCIALIRGKNRFYVDTALRDLLRHARLNFAGTPRVCEPAFADNLLVHTMNSPLKAGCGAAAMVQLKDEPSRAIRKVQKIRTPAHVIIISSHHEIYGGLLENMGKMPEQEFTMPGDEEK